MADSQRFASSHEAAQNYEQYIVQIVITPHTHAVLDRVPLHVEQLYGEVVHSSNAFTSSHVQFAEAAMGVDMGWHGVRNPQIGIILAGVMEIETGDGEKRQWRAGEIFVADDTNGKHLTRGKTQGRSSRPRTARGPPYRLERFLNGRLCTSCRQDRPLLPTA